MQITNFIKGGNLFTLLITSILLFLLLSGNASADYSCDGTVDYSSSTSTSYVQSSTHSTDNFYPSTTSLYHLFTDANTIDYIRISNTFRSDLSYTKSEITTFTATVSDVYYGAGYISVTEQLDGDVLWIIDFNTVNESYADSLVGKFHLVFNYNESIWDGVIAAPGLDYYTASLDVTSEKPTSMFVVSSPGQGFCYFGEPTPNILVSYWMSYSNYYDYYFNSSTNISTMSISRATDSSIWGVYDSFDFLYYEDQTSYSTTDIDQSFFRQSGVYANTTFNTGSGPVSVYTTIDVNGTSEGGASPASIGFNDVSWDQDPYHTGETANITTNIVNFDDTTYSYYLNLYNSNAYLTTYEITNEIESNYYEFPTDWADTSLLAKLQRVTDPDSTNEVNLALGLSHFETLNQDTTVAFNKESYDPGETLTVTWSGAPAGSIVRLRAMDDGEKVETDVAYSGSFQFTVPTGTEETYYLVDVYNSGVSQAQDSCDINIGDYWTTDDIYIDSYTVNKTTFEGQTTTVDKEESAKATLTTNINIDYIDVYYYTEEMGITITQDYDYEINGNMVNVTFPNSDHGYYYARIDVFNISTTSENRQYLFFDVGTGSKGIDIYNSKVAMMDTGEVITTESIVGYGGNDLYLPLVRTVTFDLYTDEIINSTLITSDDLEEGGLNYNFTQTYHLRRSYNFDTPGLHEIEMTVYNDETNSNDYIKWNCYVQGIDQSGLNGSVVMYWTKSEIELNGIGLLYFNVTDLPENPILEITSTTESNYETTRTLYPTQAGTETVQTNEAGVFTATMTCEGVVYAIATLTITDPTVIVEDVTEEDFSTTFDGLIASSAFIALLIIIACVGSFGKVGGAVGAVLGGIVGISISTIMEFLPWWIFFVMILALVVLFSSKVVSNIGGE